MASYSRTLLPLIGLVGFIFVAPVGAQWHEPFESATATWKMAETDASAYVVKQRRTVDRARMGSMSEYVRLHARLGSYAYLSHKVDNASVIHELSPRVSVYANRAGLQVLGVIVLPHTREPGKDHPVSTIVHGTSYTQPGVWQELTISNVPQQLARQVRRLRSQFNSDVDIRGAYLSHIVINAYTEPGVSELWIDELVINGYVSSKSVASIAQRPQPGDRVRRPLDEPTRQTTRVALQAETLRVNGRPFFPVMIEHQGEPFAWLKSLGFNCVKLARSPSGSELQAAEENDLWIVAPPPHFDDRTVPVGYDRVLCWSLGNRLGTPELKETAALASETKRHDKVLKRPLICGSHASLWQYSSIADILLLDASAAFTTVDLPRAGERLRVDKRHMRAGKPAWSYVQTQPSPELTKQLRAIDNTVAARLVVDADQMRLGAYHAIAAGCRGLCFKSRSRLDLNDPDSRARAQAIQRICLELDIIRPWLSASTAYEQVTTSQPHLHATVLKTNQAQLALILQSTPGEQFVLHPLDHGEVTLPLPLTNPEAQFYRVTPTGLRTLARDQAQVEVDRLERVTFVIATQDPHVVHYVSHRITQHAAAILNLQGSLLDDKLRRTMRCAQVFSPVAQSRHGGQLVTAKSQRERMMQAMTERDLRAAAEFAARADATVARYQRSVWQEAVNNFTSPCSSPACIAFDALPCHLRLTASLRDVAWSPNVLLTGDFEAWDALQQAGWKFDSQGTGMSAAARLSQLHRHAGSSALELTAHETSVNHHSDATGVTPLRVTSPPLSVPAGCVVRIHGWARTSGPLQAQQESLLVYDSYAGPALGERIENAAEWREFTLYRVATDSKPLTIQFVLAAHGTVWLDDVSVTVTQQPVVGRVETAHARDRLPR